jgi:two-component system chemotaxis sensor kinase CheA
MGAKMAGISLTNFLRSGRAENPDENLRYTVFNLALLAGGAFLIIFGTSVFLEDNHIRGILDFFVGILCFVTIILLRTRLPLQIPGGAAIGAFGVLCILLVSSGDLHGIAALWIYSFPLIAIFILGLQMGLIYAALQFCGIVVFVFIPGLARLSYPLDASTRIVAVYFLVSLLTVIYESNRIYKDRRVNLLNHELQVERDIIAAMKDNLKIGVFLMDRDYVIQGSYSKLLEEILETNEIEGKRFTDLLASSLKPKERETLEDYFKMVLNRQFDAKMLEDINPISEFSYIDNVNHNNKILRTVFLTVDQGLNDYYVLGSIEDISATKELERQLVEETAKRDEEMKALFQVIQVDPEVFGDFIDDTEFAFNEINDTLKNTNVSARDAMVNIFQSVHAIKSNAVILGLENFSGKLHELENIIRKYRDSDDLTFENVLRVTVELEKIMQEKDKFQNVIGKIESFRTAAGGSKRRQDRYVLVETLTQACKKAAASQNKEVAFTVDELDGSILEHGPRRVIKEVLTQLVRNSVYHGIETPQDRSAGGKDSQGTIRLSITRENGFIHLKLSDDGKGLDLGTIRKRALDLKLLSKENAENANQLLQVIFSPGFSTAGSADLHAGRGIGLNLVRERIRGLNGSIKVSSEPGKGTTFSLFIPFKDKAETKVS